MKCIIGLCGAANTGKSSTLKMLIEYLQQNKDFDVLDLGGFNNRAVGDFNTTFKHKSTTNIVCITTGGDTSSVTRENIEYAKTNKADILITATRSSGGTITELYPAINNNVPFLVSKTYQSSAKNLSEKQINELDFKNILLVLNGLLV